MKIKYSPCKWNPYAKDQFDPLTQADTSIKIVDANTLVIDDTTYTFDENSVVWPEIYQQTKGVISEAYRKDNELYLTVLTFYSELCPILCDGEYHEVKL